MKFSYLAGARGVPVHYSLTPVEENNRKVVFAGLVAVALILSLSAFLVFRPREGVSRDVGVATASAEQPSQNFEPKPAQPVAAPISQFDQSKIQLALKNWVIANKGTYSVSISEADGRNLASFDPEKKFFMASIYKLYLAYVGYQKVDEGIWSLDQTYIDNKTRGDCLDLMIRKSDNPCGEKMLSELGGEYQKKLFALGLSSTSVNAFTTNSVDSNKMLALIESGEGLSAQSKNKLMESMLKQVYRRGMPFGVQDSKVYDKVGFRGTQEYHDVGIVELPDGRKLLVSIFSNGAGENQIASLSSALRSAL